MKKIRFAGIVDSSTVDYPGKVSAVTYLCGCPFRCPWCHNRELSLDEGNCRYVEPEEIIKKLQENFMIDAVTMTGGEPLMQDATKILAELIKKETGLLLKIDTNCYYPRALEKILENTDYISTDIKAPLNEGYGNATGLASDWKKIVQRIQESHKILRAWEGLKEARTTIVPGIIESEEDIKSIARTVKETGFIRYVLQQFRAENTLDPSFSDVKSPSPELMQRLGRIAKDNLEDIEVFIITQQKGFEKIK